MGNQRYRAAMHLCVTTGLLAVALPADATPKKGWASAGNVIDVQRNGAVPNGSAIDRLLIQETFARWGLAFDEGRMDVVESLFTKDAQYRVLNASPIPFVSLDGLPNILIGVRRAMAQENTQRRHVLTNIVIEQLTPTTARADAYGILVQPDQPIVVGGMILYTADLVRDGGVWKFRKFVIGTDAFASPVPDLSHR